ncbi:putative MFS transporter [Cryobacterium sp. MP_M5]|uniref:MFS transporter n=1 Tax=unclassified Cryobacterium TaxID=2649013 RepID=UPI0018CA83AF|nr:MULTISPECIES: MFS transporter [unclassified Cryobacterium]MBG6058915.1 putative MFS transporter [Cryobacterium sp. MP_M3]MEC5177076.1 putative MFS transporter [Cryobacterium sp. MP_M5]
MSSLAIMDEAPTSKFHRKLLIACCGGPFLDGYILSLIGVALVGFVADFPVSPVQVGLIGAASLIGMFFGAIVFGTLTDRIGREKMYAVDLMVLVGACFLTAFVQGPWQLIALRFIIGLAIGADYPIATSLLTEFTPVKKRGYMIGLSALAWGLGAMTAFVVGWVMVTASGGYGLWRWMLLSGAILGVIVVVIRRGIPESPRWLIQKGRIAEAHDVIEQVYGHRDVSLSTVNTEDKTLPTLEALRLVLSRKYRKRVIMCGVLYFAQITPQYAIYIFGPMILLSFGLEGGSLDIIGTAVISLLFVIGNAAALKPVETLGRRPMTVVPFALMAIPLLALWLLPHGPVWFVILAFCFYAFVSGGPSLMEWIYPNELFPTEIRATAVGIVVAISRIGAATGTFLMPIGLDHLGVSGVMLIGAILTVIGFVVTYAWAVETKGRSLEDTSSIAIITPEQLRDARVAAR